MRKTLQSVSWHGLSHRLGQIVVDAALVGLAFWLAFALRFESADWPRRFERLFNETVLIVVLIKLAVFLLARFYTKWWRYTSLRDLRSIIVASAIASLLVFALFELWDADRVPLIGLIAPDVRATLPLGVLALDLLLTLVLVGGARLLVRSLVERPSPRSLTARADGKRVLICGAGNAGNTLLREISRNAGLGYVPVGLIDDDPRKRRMRVQGTRVLGGRADLARILREREVDEVMIAMPSAPGSAIQEIVRICRAAEVPCATLPGLPELITGEVTVSQLREVRVEDVLGRDPVEIDFARASRYLTGRVVMVTGAGGSIGSELCRQVARAGIRRLVMVDHAENNLFEIDLELRRRGHAGLVPVVADCKDEGDMDAVLGREKPDILFHAAAYKHVPMMELNPLQAVANNALATRTVARAAEAHDVSRFCLISTDKAVEPETIMGATKAIAERLIEARGSSGTRFAAVRFGNVLGSSGSVLPIFRRQIAEGGPVTVTHPDMVRYFMTIPEAVQLVIEATGIAEGGDVFVLDMGEPVRILELAEKMIELSGHEPGRDIPIEITGIRPGEKLFEELFNVDEQVRPTRYGKIRRATRPALDPDQLRAGMDDLARRVREGRSEGLKAALLDTLRHRGAGVDRTAGTE